MCPGSAEVGEQCAIAQGKECNQTHWQCLPAHSKGPLPEHHMNNYISNVFLTWFTTSWEFLKNDNYYPMCDLPLPSGSDN